VHACEVASERDSDVIGHCQQNKRCCTAWGRRTACCSAWLQTKQACKVEALGHCQHKTEVLQSVHGVKPNHLPTRPKS